MSGISKVIIAYIPVVHRGIISFLEQERVPLLVLGDAFIAEFPQLEHDLRAVPPNQIARMVEALGFPVMILDPPLLKTVKNGTAGIILPADEVMIEFAGKYLDGRTVEFRRIFIRWDRINTTSEEKIPPDTIVTSDQFTREIMARGHELAQLSSDWWRQIGAALVKDGRVIIWGVNRQQPTDYSQGIDGDIRVNFGFGERVEICGPIHAEGDIIATAARLGESLDGSDLYCTTFPCPGCARLISRAGIKRVFYQQGYSVCDAWDILKTARVQIIKFIP